MANVICVLLCVLCVQTVFCQLGFFPQRENRNGGFFGHGLLQGSRRIQDRLSGLFTMQQRPSNPQGNIYVVDVEHGKPSPNQYNGQNFGRPVAFPTNNPVYNNNEQNNENINFRPNPNNANLQPNQGNFNFQPDQGNANYQPNPDTDNSQTDQGNTNYQPNPDTDNSQTDQGNTNFQPNRDTGNFQTDQDNANFQPNQDNANFQPNQETGNFQPDQGNVNFQPDQSNIKFQPKYGSGETDTYENQPAQDGENGGEYTDDNNQDNNNVKPNEADTGVQEENDAVNFDDTPPKVLQETTRLPPLTPVPATESRNSFNFEQPGQAVFKETCQTVDGGVGSCISVYECQPYLSVIQQSRTNPNAVQLLRRAHCGFEGTAPKVCCPRPGLPMTPPPFTTTLAPTPAPTPAPTQAPTEAPQTAAPKTFSGDFVPALPEPPICGLSNATFSRVVGGVNAKLGDFPWMALLGYKSKRTGGTSWLCGGSLVSSRHVLTAAHCIHNHETDLYVVRLGELDLAREDDGATPVDILIKMQIKHEEYSPTSFTNDIGILVLDHEAPFTDLIRPICIPKETELRARSFEDYNPMIAGWGHTEFRGPAATHLQVLQLPVVSNEYCTQAYSAYKAQKIDDRVLCAGFKKGGKDACQGDSGGPLMQPIYNQQTYKTYFYQIGVVSYGKKCAEANFPGVYSRVTHFVPWIEEHVVGHSSK